MTHLIVLQKVTITALYNVASPIRLKKIQLVLLTALSQSSEVYNLNETVRHKRKTSIV